MKNNLVKYAATSGAILAGLVATFAAHAQSIFTVPSSTAGTLLANVGAQIGDPGLLAVFAVAAGVPLVFYVIHRVLGMLPGRGGGKR